MWELAKGEIKKHLYQENVWSHQPMGKFYRLMTAYEPYNRAFLLADTYEVRAKLFNSYAQLDNKN